MSDQTKFKHIKVNSDIDDDVVIYAGQPRPKHPNSDRSQPDSTDGCVVTQADEGDDMPDTAQSAMQKQASPQASTQEGAQEQSEEQAHEQAQARAKAHAQTQKSSTSRNASEYHRTTLADIEGSKMPKAQIVTIVLALMAIGAFIIWYIVAM